MTHEPRFAAGLAVGIVLGAIFGGTRAIEPAPKAVAAIDAPSEHLKLGKPERSEQLLTRKGFVVLHDNQRKIPLWAAYHLTPAYLKNPRPRLPETAFTADHELPEDGRAHPSDYRRSGFDLGHMVPSGDMRRTDAVQRECFYLSNMIPQSPQLNRGGWKDLEEHVREWVAESEEAYVYMGPIQGAALKTIGRSRVVVPAACFKIVVRKIEGKWHAMGFVADNDSQAGEPADWITRICDIELLTGFTFLSALPKDEAEALKQRMPKGLEDW